MHLETLLLTQPPDMKHFRHFLEAGEAEKGHIFISPSFQ